MTTTTITTNKIITAADYKKLRIKFEKTGLAKYISHLDLNRLFSRSLARAGIKIQHSEGFNPHPKIVFASAVSLGIDSMCEFVDIKSQETQIFEKIQKAFPQGINILEVYEPQNDFKNIDSTRFQISIKTPASPEELRDLFKGDIFAEKKPGAVINLKDYICEIKFSPEIIIDAVIKTNQAMFLNPENIIKAIIEKYNVDDYSIKKIAVLDRDGAEFA